jgi:DNA ligase (NAD+)
MEKKKFEKKYKEKIKLLNEYNKFYYEKSSPKVSDKEYDELKQNILLLEKKYKFLTIKRLTIKNNWL